MTNSTNKYQTTIERIDEINRQDPHKETASNGKFPKEYLYALRMSTVLDKYDPDASDYMKIAARGQHIKRWMIAREEYPMDRKGYLKWRTELKLMHANLVEKIMLEQRYSGDEIDQVKSLITKKKLKSDPEMQALEDVICLVFLEYYFEDFMVKHDEDKIIDILQKTWGKMTPKGQQMARQLTLSTKATSLVQRALSPS